MKKLFTNDKFFLATVLCGSVGLLVYLILVTFALGFSFFLTRLPLLIEALCVLFLYASYKKYSKNVMKGLTGALLMAILLAAINSFSGLVYPAENLFAAIYLAVAVIMFINHFYINSNHHSKPGLIKLNQVLCLVHAVNILAWNALWLVVDPSILNSITSIIDIFAAAGMNAAIVCVESRLDAYRLDREAAGWTEEKGYPENYVHQYEKK